MKPNLLCLGDSYCASSEGWPSHLAELLNANLTCYGMGGQSWYNIVEWMSQHPLQIEQADIVVFAHTNAERIPTDDIQLGLIDHSKRPELEIEHAIHLYFKYIHSENFLHFAQKLWFEHISNRFIDKKMIHLHCFDGHSIANSNLLKGINILPSLTSISMQETNAQLYGDTRKNHFSDTNNRVLAEEIYFAIKMDSPTYALNIEKFTLT